MCVWLGLCVCVMALFTADMIYEEAVKFVSKLTLSALQLPSLLTPAEPVWTSLNYSVTNYSTAQQIQSRIILFSSMKCVFICVPC